MKQALLLGTAGLLPSQRWQRKLTEKKECRRLERIWQSMGQKVETTKESDWNLSHIYPNNSPVRRIIAFNYLLDRYSKRGLLAGILQLVREAPLLRGHHWLEKGLTVSSQSYWLNHFDFGIKTQTKIPSLLGKSKAGEIIVNVILPFAFSWGKLAGEMKLANKAIELYRDYHRLAENCLTRHMAQQLGLEDISDFTACHQQGLIHIFRNYCREGRCGECPVAG